MNEQKFKATIGSTLQNPKNIRQKLYHSQHDPYKQSDLVKDWAQDRRNYCVTDNNYGTNTCTMIIT
jgi:hypothetical protein